MERYKTEVSDKPVPVSYQEYSYLTVTIRIIPLGDEIDVNLTSDYTCREIIDSLVNESDFGIPKSSPEGLPYEYELIIKRTGKKIEENQSLFEAGAEDWELLIMRPVMVAGGPSKRQKPQKPRYLSYSIPEEMHLSRKYICEFSLWDAEFFRQLPYDLPTNYNIQNVKTGDVLKVQLKENALNPKLVIKQAPEDQLKLESGRETKWRFEVFPFGIGKTSLTIKIAKVVNWKRFGKIFRDVIVLEHNLEVHLEQAPTSSDSPPIYTFDHVGEVLDDSKEKLNQIRKTISSGDLQVALRMLSHIIQGKDKNLLNHVMTLQAQTADLENRKTLGVISNSYWEVFVKQMSQKVLSFVDEIENPEVLNLVASTKIMEETIDWVKKFFYDN